MTGRRIAVWATGAVLTALYVYTIVAGVGNLLGMVGFFGEALSWTAWVALGTGVVAPAVMYVVALLLGRGRSAGMRLTLLATGLCVTALVQLDMLHLMG